MIETILCRYLSEKLRVPVWLEEPEKPPPSYVLVEKTGSSERDRITSATVAIQSYGTSMVEAAELNHSVKHAMYSLCDLDSVSHCGLVSDYNFTDIKTKRYRYQAVFNITYYEE